MGKYIKSWIAPISFGFFAFGALELVADVALNWRWVAALVLLAFGAVAYHRLYNTFETQK